MLTARVECQYAATQGVLVAGQGLHMGQAAYAWIWAPDRFVQDSKWMHRGCMWLPSGCPQNSKWLHGGCIWVHMTAQWLDVACTGPTSCRGLAPSMTPMQQICRIWCIWLGRAGKPGFRKDSKVMVIGPFGTSHPLSRMRDQGSSANN